MKRIILFASLLAAAGVSAQPTPAAAQPTPPLHQAHWDTINLFAYRQVRMADLPERITVDVVSSEGGFRAPATGRIMSRYGRRSGRDHNGIDISVAYGGPIHAAFDGTVRLSRWNSGGFGHIVIVRHPGGLETYYAHLSRRAVRAGDVVSAGDVIGYGGRTGRATAVHLHFETRYCDQSFDPERLFDFQTGELRTRTLALRKEHFSITSRSGDERDNAIDPLYALSTDDVTPPASDSLGGSSDTVPLPPPAPQPVYHRVRSGDTLLALALEHHTSVKAICALNGITRTTTLRIGRNLRIK